LIACTEKTVIRHWTPPCTKMNVLKKVCDGWGADVTLAALFHLALLGPMAWMHAVNPQHTQIAAMRVVFMLETQPAPPAEQPAPPTLKPRPLAETPVPVAPTQKPRPLAETPAPPVAEAAHAQPESAPAETLASTLDIQPLHRLSQAPRFLQRIEPAYPEAERASGRQANVVVEVVVDTHGSVLEATIVKSGGPHFDLAALKAVKQSLFVPGYMDSQSVVVRFQIPFRFQLR
jgi:TonB family protein